MYDPYAPHGYAPVHPYEWAPPRRRLNGKGVTVVLILLALLCASGLAVLKLGLVVWNSPLTPKVADSAVRIGTAAADVAMKESKVPDEVRTVVTNEAELLREEMFAASEAMMEPPAGR